MSDGKNTSPKNPGGVSWRALLIAGAVVLSVLLVAGGIAGIVAANKASSPSGVQPTTAGDNRSRSASASVATTGSAAATVTATTATDAAGSGTVGSSNDSSSTSKKAAPRPSNSVLEALEPGQWQLYGAKVVAPGAELKNNESTDIQGISVECEALTKSGKSYAHATVRISFSASGPASGKTNAWKLFGTWVLNPDDGTKDSQHYGQGIEGAMSGLSTVRPPSRSGKLKAGFSPIGAYRPKSSGVIHGGTFSGNAMFEGVLDLPSVAVPPPSR